MPFPVNSFIGIFCTSLRTFVLPYPVTSSSLMSFFFDLALEEFKEVFVLVLIFLVSFVYRNLDSLICHSDGFSEVTDLRESCISLAYVSYLVLLEQMESSVRHLGIVSVNFFILVLKSV